MKEFYVIWEGIYNFAGKTLRRTKIDFDSFKKDQIKEYGSFNEFHILDLGVRLNEFILNQQYDYNMADIVSVNILEVCETESDSKIAFSQIIETSNNEKEN